MEAFRSNEQLTSYFNSAYGFAVFPRCAKGGVGIGGAAGKGEVYILRDNGSKEDKIGESMMAQVSFGFQFGGQIYSEILFFEKEEDLERFKSGNFEFGAEASAVALTASAGAKTTTMGNQGVNVGMNSEKAHHERLHGYTKGVAVFTVATGGLMYQAAISGQKFSFKPTSK